MEKKYIVRFNGVGEILSGSQLLTLIQNAIVNNESINMTITIYGENSIPSSVAADVAFHRVFGI